MKNHQFSLYGMWNNVAILIKIAFWEKRNYRTIASCVKKISNKIQVKEVETSIFTIIQIQRNKNCPSNQAWIKTNLKIFSDEKIDLYFQFGFYIYKFINLVITILMMAILKGAIKLSKYYTHHINKCFLSS